MIAWQAMQALLALGHTETNPAAFPLTVLLETDPIKASPMKQNEYPRRRTRGSRFFSKCISALAALMLGMAWISPSRAAGDVKLGSKVFTAECAECHTMKEGKNKKGPSIYGLVGRKAATMSDYDYSGAIKSSGIVWTEEKLDAYITAPSKVVPGGKMKYEGLSNAKARQDLLAYLTFFSQ